MTTAQAGLFSIAFCARCDHEEHTDTCTARGCFCRYVGPTTFDVATEVKARETAIAQVADHADPPWPDVAYRAITNVAYRQGDLISDDVWTEIETIAPGVKTTEARAMGAVMRRAVKDGLIVASGNYRPSGRPGCHGNLVAVWRSLVGPV